MAGGPDATLIGALVDAHAGGSPFLRVEAYLVLVTTQVRVSVTVVRRAVTLRVMVLGAGVSVVVDFALTKDVLAWSVVLVVDVVSTTVTSVTVTVEVVDVTTVEVETVVVTGTPQYGVE